MSRIGAIRPQHPGGERQQREQGLPRPWRRDGPAL